MSLHGLIKVNGQVIGGYNIVRRRPRYPLADTPCTYDWEVVHRTLHGHEDRYRGTIVHRYGDGALLLISKVLAQTPPIEPNRKESDHEVEVEALEDA